MLDKREQLNEIISKVKDIISEEEYDLLKTIAASPYLIVHVARQKQLIAICDEFSSTPYKISNTSAEKGSDESTARQNYETMLKGMDKLDNYAESSVSSFNKLTAAEKNLLDGGKLQAGKAEEIQERVRKKLNV